MSWGYKIFFVIVIFLVSMIGMVIYSFQQSNEMVDEEYYEREMKYQTLIDGSKNLNAISTKDIIVQDTLNLTFKIPVELISNFNDGSIEMVKINAKSGDLKINFIPDSIGNFIIDKTKIEKGNYTARIKWKNDTLLYYNEQKIIVF